MARVYTRLIHQAHRFRRSVRHIPNPLSYIIFEAEGTVYAAHPQYTRELWGRLEQYWFDALTLNIHFNDPLYVVEVYQ